MGALRGGIYGGGNQYADQFSMGKQGNVKNLLFFNFYEDNKTMYEKPKKMTRNGSKGGDS